MLSPSEKPTKIVTNLDISLWSFLWMTSFLPWMVDSSFIAEILSFDDMMTKNMLTMRFECRGANTVGQLCKFMELNDFDWVLWRVRFSALFFFGDVGFAGHITTNKLRFEEEHQPSFRHICLQFLDICTKSGRELNQNNYRIMLQETRQEICKRF